MKFLIIFLFIGILSYLFKTIINILKIKNRNQSIDDLIITQSYN